MAIVTQPCGKALGTAFLAPGSFQLVAGEIPSPCVSEQIGQEGEGRRDREGLRSGERWKAVPGSEP